MDQNTVVFLEENVCDGGAWTLKWGTLILYQTGFIFQYNRSRKDAPDRRQDVIKIGDVTEVAVLKMDWLVTKVFWVGRKMVVIRTREGEKTYYVKRIDDLFAALNFINPAIRLVNQYKA
ncbi:MAG: hypothetical protein V1875_00325 [Candidatus Altiarchaeota archaeon]